MSLLLRDGITSLERDDKGPENVESLWVESKNCKVFHWELYMSLYNNNSYPGYDFAKVAGKGM